MQKFIKYFLKNKAVTWLLLVLILAGGCSLTQRWENWKMPRLRSSKPWYLPLIPAPPLGSSVPSDGCAGRSHSILRRVILSEDREPGWTFQDHGLREKEIRADEMQQLWDKLRRKVNDVQGKLPSGAGTSIVNDDFGDVLGVFYGLTGESYTYRELEDQAKLIKDDLLKVKDVAKVEICGIQTPVIDIRINPTILSNRGITTADIKRAFDGQNKVVDAGVFATGRLAYVSNPPVIFTPWMISVTFTIVSHSGEHFRLGDIARIEEGLPDSAPKLHAHQ